VEKVLLEFIHIRNAISHSGNAGIFPEDANHIRIIDKKPNGEISYEFTHHHHKLWSFYYWLITFDRAITTAVLMVHVADEIALMNEKYVVNLKCFYCRRTFEVFLPPWVSSVKCLKCGRTLIPNSS
jgi:ribosomal protein S27E